MQRYQMLSLDTTVQMETAVMVILSEKYLQLLLISKTLFVPSPIKFTKSKMRSRFFVSLALLILLAQLNVVCDYGNEVHQITR